MKFYRQGNRNSCVIIMIARKALEFPQVFTEQGALVIKLRLYLRIKIAFAMPSL